MKENIAPFGILDVDGKDNISYEEFEDTYNVNTEIDKIKKLQFPFRDKILELFYGNR